MANNFTGLLLQTSIGVVPCGSFIKQGSYSATPDQETDLDAYTDNDGKLHRNPLPHTSTKIEFETIYMTLDQKIAFMAYFPNDKYILMSSYWNDKTNSYKAPVFDAVLEEYTSGVFYMPTVTWNLDYIETASGIKVPHYFPTRIALIEY